MKKYILLILTIATYGCNMIGAGTLGTFEEWTIPMSEEKVDAQISSFLQQNTKYNIPEKYEYLDSWEESGYGFLNGKIFYFSAKPEEMYYVTYHPNIDPIEKDTTTIISVRAVCNGNSRCKWRTIDDYKNNMLEIQRIENRFYKEIITKIEKWMNVKTKQRKKWPFIDS